jgi:hypothetical protein
VLEWWCWSDDGKKGEDEIRRGRMCRFVLGGVVPSLEDEGGGGLLGGQIALLRCERTVPLARMHKVVEDEEMNSAQPFPI